MIFLKIFFLGIAFIGLCLYFVPHAWIRLLHLDIIIPMIKRIHLHHTVMESIVYIAMIIFVSYIAISISRKRTIQKTSPKFTALDSLEVSIKTNLQSETVEEKHASTSLSSKANADPNIQDEDGRTMLWIAANQGHATAAKALIEENANIDMDIQDKDGRTALWIAARKGHKYVVEVLIKANANLDVQDQHGRSVVLIAAAYCHENIVMALANANANLDIQDNNGRTALCLAAFKGQEAIVNALIKKGANLDIQDKDGQTALRLAVTTEHMSIVEALLNAHAAI